MNKVLLSAIALSAVSFSAYADCTFSWSGLENIVAGANDVKLYVIMDYNEAVPCDMFMFDILMPAGVEYVEYDTTDRLWISKKDNWDVMETIKGDGWVRYICDTDGTPITKDDEEKAILEITVNVSNSYTGGSFGFAKTQILTVPGDEVEYEFDGEFLGTATFTLGESGYSTFCTTADCVASGANVYFGEVNGDELNLIKSTGNVIPANTGVLIKGNASATVTLTPAESAVEKPATNCLKGTDCDANFDYEHGDDYVFVLSLGEDGIGFYKYSGTNIARGHAYIPFSAAPSATRVRIAEDVNVIESINMTENTGINFNLMGQQVKSQKGFVIENGKKVMNF